MRAMLDFRKLDLSWIRYADPCKLEDAKRLEQKIDEFLSLSGKGPLRLQRTGADQNSEGHRVQTLYLRERTWPEFFYEKVIASPGRIASIEADVRREIDAAFSPLIFRLGQPQTGAMVNGAYPANFVTRRDALLSRISESAEKQSGGFVKIKPGLTVSDCSPLDAACNFAVVSTAFHGSETKGKIMEWNKAKQTFDEAWEAKRSSLMPACSGERGGAAGPLIIHTLNARGNKLDHIQEIRCVPDNPLSRSQVESPDSFDREFWKGFYLKCLAGLHGGGVIQPYPDRWQSDAEDELTPVYSLENLRGMLDAGIELTDAMLAKEHGRLPISLMFAVQNREVSNFLQAELCRRKGIAFTDEEKAQGLAASDAADDPSGMEANLQERSELINESDFDPEVFDWDFYGSDEE
jgi:hypothetical protein